MPAYTKLKSYSSLTAYLALFKQKNLIHRTDMTETLIKNSRSELSPEEKKTETIFFTVYQGGWFSYISEGGEIRS